MKTAIVNMMKCTPGSIIASNRIATYLAYQLGCPLIDSRETCHGDYDRLFIVNGPMLYCNFRLELQALCNRAAELIWVENDYTLQPPSFIKSREPYILSNMENYRAAAGYQYVNWNQLTYDKDMASRPVTNPGLLYYGAFRKGREIYFRKYLAADGYPVAISSSAQGAKKFFQFAPRARYLAPSELSYIGSFQACLYIEDTRTHEVYNSPANRFYEALSAHALQLFDKSCLGTFETAGIDIGPWVVDGPEDVARALKQSDQLRADQLRLLRAVDYKDRLENELNQALKTLRG